MHASKPKESSACLFGARNDAQYDVLARDVNETLHTKTETFETETTSLVLAFLPHRVCVSGRDVRLVTFVSEFVNRFSTGIFVQDRIFFIIIIQFRGNLFRYYLVFVRQILIIFVIVIVN